MVGAAMRLRIAAAPLAAHVQRFHRPVGAAQRALQRLGVGDLSHRILAAGHPPHRTQSQVPRSSSLTEVFARVFSSTCFTITAQYSEWVPSAAGSDPLTTTLPAGTRP